MRILEPLSIGLRTAPNRVMFGPHETNLAWGRSFSDRHAAYYGERAAGGCGTIVTETASIHRSDWPYERCPDATDLSSAVTGWREIVAQCRPHGSLVIGSLGHSGGQGSSAYSQRELWAPSDEPDVDTGETPKIMEVEDIAEVVAGFSAGAKAAREADLDGIEINAGQHSLLRQFLSGLTNRRSDSYGLTEGPLRLATEVLKAARSELGHDRVLGLRLSCDELAPWAGITPERGAEIAASLASLVDYIVVVRGSIFTVPNTRPDAHHSPGFNLGLAGDVARAVAGAAPSVAVFAQGSLVDPAQAESVIDTALVDGVEMTRAQIADPDLISKLSADQSERVRPCLLCNQLCMVRDNRNPIVSCVVNPRAGYETIDPEPVHIGLSPGAKRVMVVGGGPAGMEAARVAAERGAAVRLLEASPEMGGMLKLMSLAPARQRFGLLIQWLEAECRRLGVAIGAGTPVTPQLIERFNGDLIIATGSRERKPEYTIDGDAICLTASDALTGSIRLPKGPLAIWDPVGGLTGIAVAEHAIAAGHEVILITPDQIVGTQLARTGDLAGANVRLQQAGAHIVRRARVTKVARRHIEIEQVFTGAQSTIGAIALIDAGHRLPNDHLFRTIGGDGTRVGDVVAPRTVAEAMREGRDAAVAVTPLPEVSS